MGRERSSASHGGVLSYWEGTTTSQRRLSRADDAPLNLQVVTVFDTSLSITPDPLFTACTPRPLFYPPVECFLGWQPGVLGERAGHVAASMGGARTFLIIPFLFWDALVLG